MQVEYTLRHSQLVNEIEEVERAEVQAAAAAFPHPPASGTHFQQ